MLDGWNPMMHVIIMLAISPGLCVYTVLKESVNNSEKTLLGVFFAGRYTQLRLVSTSVHLLLVLKTQPICVKYPCDLKVERRCLHH